MFELRCSVRNCEQILHDDAVSLRCDAGHHFDRAKQGYWNLLQPQDAKSLKPGDCQDAVFARHRWLQRGHASGLVDALRPWCDRQFLGGPAATNLRTLDLGCGEGSFGPLLFGNDPDTYCGIDLSKQAIKFATARWPAATWVMANADRVLPVADNSVARIVSLFGRRPVDEICRSLSPGGICIVAVPGEDDLIELRSRVQATGERRSRWQKIVDEMVAAGLRHLEHRLWRQQLDLEPESIADALAMTYRSGRNSRKTRLESIESMPVTVAADLLLFKS